MARTNSTTALGPTSAPRAVVRELAGQAPRLDVVFDVRTAFDFLISVKGGERDEHAPDLLAQDAAWLERSTADLSPAVRADIEAYFGEDSLGLPYSLPMLLVNHPEVTNAAAYVDLLRAMPADQLAVALLHGVLGKYQSQDRSRDIVAGDTNALDSACEPFDQRQRDMLTAFVERRDEELARMLGVLEAWLPRYQEVEARVGDILRRDVASRQADRAELSVPDLIERTTGGLRLFPSPGVRRVILAPQYFGRPFNYVFQGSDWRMWAYPVAETALGPADKVLPPQATVRLYRALGDATRMRILRLLAERDWYLTELAQQLELSKPTMKHHLALLRAAGLVTVTEEGSLTYYSLRRERVREAGVELQHYIG
jgi:DNA-binding transcriptional ArsR family regulator